MTEQAPQTQELMELATDLAFGFSSGGLHPYVRIMDVAMTRAIMVAAETGPPGSFTPLNLAYRLRNRNYHTKDRLFDVPGLPSLTPESERGFPDERIWHLACRLVLGDRTEEKGAMVEIADMGARRALGDSLPEAILEKAVAALCDKV